MVRCVNLADWDGLGRVGDGQHVTADTGEAVKRVNAAPVMLDALIAIQYAFLHEVIRVEVSRLPGGWVAVERCHDVTGERVKELLRDFGGDAWPVQDGSVQPAIERVSESLVIEIHGGRVYHGFLGLSSGRAGL